MHAPAEIQRRLARAILAGPEGDLADIVEGGGLTAERRVGMHRNHFQISLAQALATTFPATAAVLGADFFAQTARSFALAHPPTGPCLFEYGAGLPDYLDALPALGDLPYVGDLARFEWTLNAVHHAPDQACLDPARLAALAPAELATLRFLPTASAALLASDFPILDIWRLARGATAETVTLDAGGTRLLIHRQDDAAVWREMSQAEFAFLSAIFAGETLDAAATPDLDLAAMLAFALAAGLFQGLARDDAQ